MTHIFKIILPVLVVCSLLSGCVAYVFNEPMAVSTKSVVYSHIGKTGGKAYTDQSNGFIVLFPYITDPRKVWDRLLDSASAQNCNAVVDLQLRYTDRSFIWMFPPIVWINSEAEGTAVQVR